MVEVMVLVLVKEMPHEERPREKAEKFGVGCLSNVELLAILIRSGVEGHSSIEIANQVLKKSQGLTYLSRLNRQDLCEVKGIKTTKAIVLLACFELAKRVSFCESLDHDVMENPTALVQWLKLELGNQQQEKFLVVYLNVKNHILGSKILFVGTVDSSIVHPREIFKEAVLKSASKMIIVHNHPSTDLLPSKADIVLTQKLIECGQLMGIEVLDHIIVSNSGFLSFKAKGFI